MGFSGERNGVSMTLARNRTITRIAAGLLALSAVPAVASGAYAVQPAGHGHTTTTTGGGGGGGGTGGTSPGVIVTTGDSQWASDEVDAFQAGTVKNSSTRYSVPGPVLKRIKRYHNNHPASDVWWTADGHYRKRDCSGSWASIGTYVICRVYGDNPSVSWITNNIGSMDVDCGGQAVFAFIPEIGWTAFGVGASKCMWSHLSAMATGN